MGSNWGVGYVGWRRRGRLPSFAFGCVVIGFFRPATFREMDATVFEQRPLLEMYVFQSNGILNLGLVKSAERSGKASLRIQNHVQRRLIRGKTGFQRAHLLVRCPQSVMAELIVL